MVNGIGNSYDSYGVGGFPTRQNNDVNGKADESQQPPVQPEQTPVDPSKVMEFLSANNIFVAAAPTEAPEGVDPQAQERVEGYMAQFEVIYGLITEEFGEELAPAVMDLVMDKLMGMAA